MYDAARAEGVECCVAVIPKLRNATRTTLLFPSARGQLYMPLEPWRWIGPFHALRFGFVGGDRDGLTIRHQPCFRAGSLGITAPAKVSPAPGFGHLPGP